MSSAFFLKTPSLIEEHNDMLRGVKGKPPMTSEESDRWPGVVIRNEYEAVTRFRDAVQTEEWAELKWSS